MSALKVEDLHTYQLAHAIGNEIWNCVARWNQFDKNTLGYQIIRAADSISLNICEGFGRFHFKENRQFCFYARGSLYETKECIEKAYVRQIITHSEYTLINELIIKNGIKLNNYIKSIGPVKK